MKLKAQILTTSDVAEALSWDTQRARRWLKRSGAGIKRGGRIVTTPVLLASHFPELYQQIALDLQEAC